MEKNNIDDILDELFDLAGWIKVDKSEESSIMNNELVITKDERREEEGHLSLFIVNRYRFISDKSKKISEKMIKTIMDPYDYKYLYLADNNNREFFK